MTTQPEIKTVFKPKVLVVDDDKITVDLLCFNLNKAGYVPVASCSPKDALEKLRDFVPDLIILDLMLPEIDGLSLCRKIKASPTLADTPVIFLTSDERSTQKVEAFHSGAVDYVTKPIRPMELLARVETHIKLSLATRKIKEYAENMEKIAQDRARQLIHSDRLATLGTLASGIAHEINNPASFISGNVQTLEKFCRAIHDTLGQSLAGQPRLVVVLNEMPALIDDIKDGVRRIHEIVNGLKLYARKEDVAVVPVGVIESVEKTMLLCRQVLNKNRVLVTKNLPESEIYALASPLQLQQVLVNLCVNAVDACPDGRRLEIQFNVEHNPEQVCLAVSDNGTGIPGNIIEKIWDPFFSTKEPGRGTGLGLSISKSIIESFGGTIRAENRIPCGARFEIRLPASNPPKHIPSEVAP